jgi:hypothetical protein
LEFPVYYMDYWDLGEQASGFRLEALGLDRPGLKVFDFHPNLVFTNASTLAQYLGAKRHYHDPERLLGLRRPGRGTRTLFVELLEFVANGGRATWGLGELNAWVRARALAAPGSAEREAVGRAVRAREHGGLAVPADGDAVPWAARARLTRDGGAWDRPRRAGPRRTA